MPKEANSTADSCALNGLSCSSSIILISTKVENNLQYCSIPSFQLLTEEYKNKSYLQELFVPNPTPYPILCQNHNLQLGNNN